MSSFNFKFQFQVSISSFNYKFQFQVSISSFNFMFQFQVSMSSFNSNFQFQVLDSSFSFKFQFQVLFSSFNFKFQFQRSCLVFLIFLCFASERLYGLVSASHRCFSDFSGHLWYKLEVMGPKPWEATYSYCFCT